MGMNLKRVAMICAATSMFAAPAFAGSLTDTLAIPSLETKQAIEALAVKKAPDFGDMKYLTVEPSKAPFPNVAAQSPEVKAKPQVPFVAQNSMILQFQPNVEPSQVDDYIKSNKLEVVKTFPSLGAIQVQTDLSRFFRPQAEDKSTNDTILRGFIDASTEFKRDPRIREATPDVLLQRQSKITNFMVASSVMDKADGKMNDWGIADIQADKVWEEDGARNGVIFGVMDVGFAKHENLVFIDPKETPAEDHGNHVAGIACGSHATPLGARGVLPNCFIRAHHSNVFFESTEGDPVAKLFVLFSQILTSLTTFLESFDDVSVFNVSLGYNWINNLGFNPDAPEHRRYRQFVEIQAPLLVTALQKAEKQGKVVFSAAGNDSEGIDPPVGAKYASPFNWAAITARSLGTKSGVIVEAHGTDGKRAAFSNTGGHISCPGVDVLSSVAFDKLRKPSKSAYGLMSGTSMASPYCAAGLVLFRLVRPQYSADAALECLLKSTIKSNSGAPMLRLKDAVTACS